MGHLLEEQHHTAPGGSRCHLLPFCALCIVYLYSDSFCFFKSYDAIGYVECDLDVNFVGERSCDGGCFATGNKILFSFAHS